MAANTESTTARLREEWLANLAGLFLPEIAERAGVTVPAFRVTCGFPSRGGELGNKTRVRGQCWTPDASGDGHAEIFISPVEDDAKTVAAILAHELMHAALGVAEGHGKRFQLAMSKLGHVAPFTSAVPTADFEAWTAPLLAKVGAYPHAALVAMKPVGAPKKQSARLLKAVCQEEGCGYTVRVTRKWVVEAGAPICPKHRDAEMTVEGMDDDGEGPEPVPADWEGDTTPATDLVAQVAEAAEDVAMIREHLENERANAYRFRDREGKAWIKRQLRQRGEGLAAAEVRLASLQASLAASQARERPPARL